MTERKKDARVTNTTAAKRGRKPKRWMTAAEFEAVRPLLKNISPERIEAARLALVEGRTLQAIGLMFGWTRQAADDAVAVVWKTTESYRAALRAGAEASARLPPGWEQVTLVAPDHLIAKFRAELAQLARPPDEGGEEKPGAVKRRAVKST